MRALLLVVFLVPSAHAGRLKGLEKALTKPASANAGGLFTRSGGDDCGGLIECLLTIFLETLINAQSVSYDDDAVPNDAEFDGPNLGWENPSGRLHGMLDFGYQRIDGNIDGAAGALELGWGPWMLGGEFLRYWEYDPPDRLDSRMIEAKLRLPSEFVWIDLAAGYRSLRREVTADGAQGGLSVHFLPSEYVRISFDFRFISLGGNALGDHRARLHVLPWGRHGLGLRMGYRGLRAEGNTLGGPEAGVFFQF